MIAVLEQRHHDARRYFEEAMRLNTEVGDTWHVALGHNNLGNASRGLGDGPTARGHYLQALRVYREYDDRWALAFLLEDIAQLAAAGAAATALQLLGAADRMRADIDAPRAESRERELADALTPGKTGMTAEQLDRARATGRTLGTRAAVEVAVKFCSAFTH
jgi:hypothetical protein